MEHIQTQTSSGVLQLLLTAALFSFLIWIIQFHWNRRKMYKMVENIPGPKGYPIVGNTSHFLGLSHKVIIDTMVGYFSKYQGFFKLWIGPKPIIFMSRPEDLEIVLNHQHCLERDIVFKFMSSYLGNGLVTAPVDIWRRHRKLINPTFNQKILDSFVAMFNKQANAFIEVLMMKSKDKDFDIFDAVNICILDIICETIIGIETKARKSTLEFGKLWDRIFLCGITRVMNVFYYPDFVFKHTKYHIISEESSTILGNFTKELIRNKKLLLKKKQEQIEKGEVFEDEKKRKSFLDHLLHLTQDSKALTEEEVMYEVNTITVAGSDTTTTALCFMLLCLALHPDIQAKVLEEVIDVLGYDRDVTIEDMSQLQYMDRCIKESLRIFPSVPVIFRKSTANIDLGHAVLPAYSSLVIGTFHTHRSPEYWKNPLNFDPDRFLPEEVAKRDPLSFLPFSAGPRGCLGMKYAEMAMKTILAIIIRKFVIKTEYRSVEEVELMAYILLRPTAGFKVSLEPR